jgi:hypothetical protein
MPETIGKQCNPAETKVVGVITDRARLVLEVFLAGSGLMLWVSAMFFNPMNDVKTDLKLIKQEISTIEENHLVHVQDSIKAIEDRNAEADKRQNDMQLQIVRMITILEEEKNK